MVLWAGITIIFYRDLFSFPKINLNKICQSALQVVSDNLMDGSHFPTLVEKENTSLHRKGLYKICVEGTFFLCQGN